MEVEEVTAEAFRKGQSRPADAAVGQFWHRLVFSEGLLPPRCLEIDTQAGDSKGRVGTRGGCWTGLVRVVKEEEEPEELSGEIEEGRNYKGRHNLGK